MSNAVLPAFPGKGWGWQKRPTFKTEVFRAMSGREVRAPMMAYPLWEFQLKYDLLRDNLSTQSPVSPFDELKNMVGFFLSRNGAADSFLFDDNTDNAVTDQVFGSGDGSASAFQLARSYGGFIEPVMNVHVLTNIKKDGVTQTSPDNYSIDAAGLVTFTSPPGGGANLTWTGTYYYRCRFMDDAQEFTAFMLNLWENKRVNFVGAPGNKV